MAECNDCDKQSGYVAYNVPRDCDKLPLKDCKPIDASCVFYTSSPLSIIGVTEPNPSAEFIFQKIDEFLASVVGANYNLYDTACLGATATQQEFVETISQFVCTLRDDLDAVGISGTDISAILARLNAIENPNLSLCTYIGTTSSSTLNEILVAISERVCELNDYTGVSAVDWDLSYTVLSSPTTVGGGFDELLRQMAIMKASIPASLSLPTFNTTLSCLPTITSATPLVTVVNELIQKVCTTSPFTPTSLSWGCVTPPATINLTTTIQSLLSEVSNMRPLLPIFDATQFTTNTLGCSGQEVTLSSDFLSTLGMVSVSESVPMAYMADIIEAGTNITIDNTNPQKIKINATDSGKVKVASTGNPKYLKDAVQGSTNEGLTINVQEVAGNLVISPSIDEELFVDNLLTTISNNPTLLAKLCNLICQCQSC